MYKSYLILIVFAFAKAVTAQSQEEPAKVATLDVSYLYGSILQHNPDISHLITGHPTGFLLSYNRKTFGEEEWQSRFNYPDLGLSMAYQDLNNEFLGEAIGLYGHYNFHFFNRNLQFRIGQGFAYMTNPFDLETNPRNNAYGTRITSSTYLNAVYRKENIAGNLGAHAGVSIIHYSNANVRAPNNSTNSWLFNVGLNYTLNGDQTPEFKTWERRPYSEPISVNAIARLGFNESDYRGSGQYPFYDFSIYADKRINLKSSLHAGTELFVGTFLKEYRDYQAASFPESGLTGEEDFRRVGVFVGHELHLNKTSVLTQFGYYAYWPIEFESRIYNRIGLQRRLSDHVFASMTVKSHGAKAEGVSLGIGYRLDAFKDITKRNL